MLTDQAQSDCLDLGEWNKRERNRCVEVDLLRAKLLKHDYSEARISAVVQKRLAAADSTGSTRYQANLRS